MPLRLSVLVATLAAAVAASAALPARGAADPPPVLYVDPGSVGGACDDARGASATSADRPLCTLPRALSAAPAGARIELRRATYPFLRLDGFARSAQVTVAPYGSESPVLMGMELDNISNLRFRGLRIGDLTHVEDATSVAFEGNDMSPHGAVVGGVRDFTFEGNVVHDLTMRLDPATGNCVEARCGFGLRLAVATDVTIRGNRFRHIPADGIQMARGITDVRVTGNVFEWINPSLRPEEHSDSIQLLGDSDGVRVEGNLFHDVRGPLMQVASDGTGVQRGMVFANNVFARMRNWAVNLFDAPGATLVNNTAYDGSGRIKLNDHPAPGPMTGAVLVNNLVSTVDATPGMFARRDHNIVGGGLRDATIAVAGAPRFVNESAFDYQLAPGSPGVDAAAADVAPPLDLAGRPRVDLPGVPNGTAGVADLGAYELQASGPGDPVLRPGPVPGADPAVERPGYTTPPPAGSPAPPAGAPPAPVVPPTPVIPPPAPATVPPPAASPTPTAPGRLPDVARARVDVARGRVLAAGRARLRLIAVHGKRPSDARVGTVLTQKPAANTALRSDGRTLVTLRYWSGKANPARTCTPDVLAPDLAGMEIDLAVRILRDFHCKPDLVLAPTADADVPRLGSVAAGSGKRVVRVVVDVPRAPARQALRLSGSARARAVVDRRGRRVAGATVTVDRGARAADLVRRTGRSGKVGIPAARGTGVLITQTVSGVTRYGAELPDRRSARTR